MARHITVQRRALCVPIEAGGPRSHRLVGDGSGVCLYSKTLEEQSFCWPGISAARIRLDHSQLMALLAGLDGKRSGQPRSGGRC
ncbi:IS66 family insertion sequence element accessory protein TnpB [Ensifer adhaerens]|uniref:IS66 family insertion sequence element accessory protein TnpB n=1 Tax=Ensifer adhaerens TaxID=106592 RepID=UPI00384E17E4